MPKITIVALAAAALAALTSAAGAATAHNSQAGADGPNSRQCDATPYFAAGGCFSAAVENDRRYPFDETSTPDPAGRRLAHPALPLEPPRD